MVRYRLTQVLFLSVFLAVLCPWAGFGQESPETEIDIDVSTDAGEADTLTFGLDPEATDSIDTQFGESELPPAPPSGVFDARWIDDDIEPSTFGEGLLVDIRQGSSSFNGTRQHELQFQTEDSATEVTIEWDLPAGVTGTIEDKFDGSVYGPVEMEGNDSLTVDPGDPAAILTIDYNAPPTLDTNEGTTLDEGGQVAIPTDSLSASDPDNDPSALTFTVTDGPTEGTLLVGGTTATEFTQQDLINDEVAYDHTADVPPGEIPANDEFTFDLKDGKDEGPTGNVFSVTVLATNDPPAVESDADTTQQGTPVSASAPGLLGNDSDPNGDPLSVSEVNGNTSDVGQQVTLASGALLTVEGDGAYSYAPNGAFEDLDGGETGSDSFTYTASDGNGGTSQATVTLTIEGVNGVPVAADDSFLTYEDSTLTVDTPGVLGNDEDPEDDPLTPSVVSVPENGTLTLSGDGSFEYVPALGFAGTDSFTYEVSDGNGGTDQATVTLEVNGTYIMSVEDGWNLFSVPYQLDDQTFGAVLPSCTSGFFFEAGSGNQPIADGDTLSVGEGFWAKCALDTVQLVGQEPGSQTVGVAEGWNLIGPFADSVNSESISSDPSGIIETPFFGFDQSGGYAFASVLAPGDGYWIKASQAGTLDLTGGDGSSSLASRSHLSDAQEGREGAEVQLQVTDREGQEATLWLGHAAPTEDGEGYQLPPTPPGDVFDVRFAGGTFLATWAPGTSGTSFRDVQLQGADYPLTLRLKESSPSVVVHVKQGSSPSAPVTTLTPEAPSMTVQGENEGLQVALIQVIPDNFALESSTPNPARGQATIRYRVPKQVRVQINLYDILGRKVMTLAEGEKKAGTYSVRFDVRSLSSGRYFYRMSAGAFSRSRRMNVVR